MNDLTAVDHWDDAWAHEIRLRLPSPWVIPIGDIQRLLARHVRPGMTVLEIGCAPGKILAWVAARRGAQVAGLDFSPRGLSLANRLFTALKLTADLRCEDLRRTTFAPGAFDFVYSIGVIEHFADPREIVGRHVSLVRPGGTVLMTVPNYRGLYGVLQRYFDADSLLLHNLDIMSCDALARLVPQDEPYAVRTYRTGRLSPWLLSTEKRWPTPLARGLSYAVNAVALLQPFEIATLAPMLALEVARPNLTTV
jgi:2-polyprenyl-3-methyl-5-hydroxy-6-metoxy-1,4-benzoquinol methylase